MINISTVSGQIGIKTTNAKLLITQPPPFVELKQKHPKVIIDTEHVQVIIDQRQCFNDTGLMDFLTLTEDGVQRAKQAVFEGIARRAQEGDMLAAIESGMDAIAEIAYNNSFESVDYNLAVMPISRPKIDFKGGTVDIKVDEGYVSLHAVPNKPQGQYEPGRVEIFMLRNPDIKITHTGNNVDKKL